MKQLISSIVEKSISNIYSLQEKVEINIPNKRFGDYSTNIILQISSKINEPIAEIAAKAVNSILKESKLFKNVECTKNGFINFTINDEYLSAQIKEIRKQGKLYGTSSIGKGKTVLLEFVSANPTGPLHIGHGRWAAIGDNIASLLSAVGYKVEREYYINDVGNQVEKLELSVRARANNKEIPEGGYGGAYVIDLAEKLKADLNKPNFRILLINAILDDQKRVLREFGLSFDNYYSEETLHKSGKVKETLNLLDKSGNTFNEGGALWFKSMDLGDDKNRVLVKETGETTYFAADIAYHLDKFKRGYSHIINIWGADHHGYVPRLKAALKALGLETNKLEIIIGQMVALFRGKEPVKMSKRTGEMITLEEVIQEIGKDSARFFLAMTSAQSHLEFDLELAKKHAASNPVYYVQYAHARLCSIFREGHGIVLNEKADLGLLTHPAERDLILKLISIKDEIISAALKREPHIMIEYAKNLSALFHNYYHKCRILSDDLELTSARLMLADAARIVLKNVLELLKVEAPERM
ncbi:MAG: arginyl-tRNA synthetase [Candidatus Saganbacteria bacterium]|uniref:Arginine--tRNA ligase n=1 Tax=Candidatus Saganbacteria bacterium TaxID=2575572 RepID=A0A833L104_UNCSA|nr:MAG: arginyl-tRNA synthetase [Candidatus Saganbacteria bacterium]